MLMQRMRQGAASIFAKALLSLLVLSFAAWGIADYIRVTPQVPVATVGSIKIMPDELSREYRRDLQSIQQRLGMPLDAEQARQLGLIDTTLDRLVEGALLDLVGEKLGLRVSDAAVRDDIVNSPAFRTATGAFDRMRFEAIINNAGFNEAGFIQIRRRELRREMVVGAVANGAATVPLIMAETMFRYRNERRAADTLVILNDRLPAPREPKPEELEAFHKDNASRFTAPEYRSLTYTVLSPADIAGAMEVSDQDIKDEYEAHLSSYVTPEKRRVEQLVFATEGAAREALAQVQGATTFAMVAEKTQKKKAADITLGPVSKNDLPAAIATPVFELKLNEISPPLPSPFGWHLVRITAIEPGSTRTLDAARAEIKRELALRLAADELIKVRNKIDDRLAGGASLEDAIKGWNFVIQTATVDQNGSDEKGKPVNTLPPARSFLSSAFDQPERADLDVRDGEGGTYFIVRVDRVTQSALKPLDAVKTDVANGWKAAERDRMAAERASAILEKLKGGADMQMEARLNATTLQGGNMGATAAISRQGTVGEGRNTERPLSPAVVSALFRLKVGEFAMGPNARNDGYTIVRLTQIEAADPARDKAGVERLQRELAQGAAQDVLSAFRASNEAEFGVKIDRAAIQRAL